MLTKEETDQLLENIKEMAVECDKSMNEFLNLFFEKNKN